jgi:probable HAF family extracellular repeat protein
VIVIITTTIIPNLEFTANARSTSAVGAPSRRSSTDRRGHSGYRLIELPTLGGAEAFANWINDAGWVAGAADLASVHAEHAFLWRKKTGIRDLGTLGGKNSLAWPVNDLGEVAGDSETSSDDPNHENFCHFVIDGKGQPSDRTCLAYVWSQDKMTPLPTLGGNNDQAFGLNDQGQVVGIAENGTRDASCAPPQVLDFEAVIWGPKPGETETLPPLPGDAISGALAINARGVVVGASGACGPVNPAIGAHAVLWRNGSPTDLGGFGGQSNNDAFDINDQGQVAGFSDLPSDTTTHAFLWQKIGGMKDLGTLPGDFASFAFGINDDGQVVGESCNASFSCRAFIWQDGTMSDLNALVSPGTSLQLTLAESINGRGEITGIAYDPSTGGIPAFVAIPEPQPLRH